jgi:chemotaxis protein MotB
MNDDDQPSGIPEWVVTFGDMMSLLLTFFIMLVSMSEIKHEEKYQAMVESIQRRFGHQLTTTNVTPGDSRPRESEFRVLSTMGRAKRLDTHKGGVPTKAPVGEQPRVRIVRPGSSTAIGTVLFFESESHELSEGNRAALDTQMIEMAGKPQKIEIRGHTSQQLALQGTPPGNAMDLSYLRCRNVMQYLVDKHKVPPERIRLSTAGAWEPMYLSGDIVKMQMNPRVEIFLLEETVDQLLGTAEERSDRILDP